ncbi:hypothetical protein [Desulfospira joergensenii]|uniref:hypothetical protein n=1 Tax=Desulfospira joergensenii TaxID=53329 RepID=UPI00129467EB|nr:hypothetical protein [Desulfospira joergensenii]
MQINRFGLNARFFIKMALIYGLPQLLTAMGIQSTGVPCMALTSIPAAFDVSWFIARGSLHGSITGRIQARHAQIRHAAGYVCEKSDPDGFLAIAAVQDGSGEGKGKNRFQDKTSDKSGMGHCQVLPVLFFNYYRKTLSAASYYRIGRMDSEYYSPENLQAGTTNRIRLCPHPKHSPSALPLIS